MIKKVLLSLLLLIIIIGQASANVDNLNTRFQVSDAVKYKIRNAENCNAYILTDNITGVKYLVLDNTHCRGYAGIGGIAITPLVKKGNN